MVSFLLKPLQVLIWENLYRWRARILYAPFTVTQAGITEPPNPEYGPWRRVDAQSNEADILIDGTPAASGNSNNSSGAGCFISVSASGSQLEPHVMALREFQDGYLLNKSPGKINAALGFFLGPGHCRIGDFIRKIAQTQV